MAREERRQNDGVAIKYTAGSEEHTACCREAALWWCISAPSLHLFFFAGLVTQLWIVSCLLHSFSHFFLLSLLFWHCLIFFMQTCVYFVISSLVSVLYVLQL